MKAFTQVWKSITGVPAADMKDKRYTFVSFDANGKVVTSAEGGYAAGVIYEPNNVDQPAQVVASGYAFVKLGADIPAGTVVMSSATGEAVEHVAGTAPAVNHAIGVLQVGGATGEIGTVLLK